MLTFTAMTESEFSSWLPVSLDDYLTEIIASGEEIVVAEANLKATQDGLFPDGNPAKGQHFLKVYDGEIAVGMLWIREPQIEGSVTWYIYLIMIDEKFRGKGYGRRTMEAAENWVRERGGSRIALNVFGQNLVAQSLYDSLGFTAQAKRMFKDL